MANKIPLAIADLELQLASSLAVGGTSFTLSGSTDDDGTALPAGMYCFTVDNGTSNKEYLLGQVNGTAVTSVVSVSRQGVESAGAARKHRIGAPVILTDFATIQRVADILRGQVALDGANPVGYDAEPTLADRKDLATVGYVLDTVVGGTVAFDSMTITGTGGEAIVAGNLVYFKTSDQEWYKTDADTAATVEGVQLGIALGTGSDGVSITGGVQIGGVYTTTGLTAGALYYASNTAGAIADSAGTTKVVIGLALSTTKLLILPKHPQTPTTREKDAMAGGGDIGTPSTTNKFITEDYFPIQFATENAINQASLLLAPGPLSEALVKTYYTFHLPFILATGESTGDADTSFEHWSRSGSSNVLVTPGGPHARFDNTGTAFLHVKPFFDGQDQWGWASTNIVIMDFWALLPASATGSINLGFGTEQNTFVGDWNDTSANGSSVKFSMKPTGELMAVVAEESVGVSSSDISSGLTLTNWNNYRIKFDLNNSATFYVNGVEKYTYNGANLELSSFSLCVGFGRSNTASFRVTAPYISLQMNP